MRLDGDSVKIQSKHLKIQSKHLKGSTRLPVCIQVSESETLLILSFLAYLYNHIPCALGRTRISQFIKSDK